MGQEWVRGCVAGPGEANGSLDLWVQPWKNLRDIHKGKEWDWVMVC